MRSFYSMRLSHTQHFRFFRRRSLFKTSFLHQFFNVFYSPNYPFPYQTNVVCRYFIYGMQDEQNLERVRLTFEKFNIPMSPQSDCEDGYLKVYMKGQEKEHHYEEHDYQFCGRETPPTVKTEGPRLVLLFKAGQKPGSGFKGNFKFETEYLIPIGTPAPEGGCHFTYRCVSKLTFLIKDQVTHP